MATNPNLRPCDGRFEQLPKELVMDILSRVSVKALFSCRCVCKYWLYSISDPEFPHLHRLTSPIGILSKNEPRGPRYHVEDSTKLQFTQLQESACGSDFQVQRMQFTTKNNLPIDKFHLINSYNGLLCLSRIMDRDDTFYVCNPILGEYITLPPTNWHSHNWWRTFSGIGYSATTNEYKVLRTSRTKNQNLVSEIYTIGTGAWRSIGLAPALEQNIHVNSQGDCFLHGALHWISNSAESPVYSFNFEIEQFRPIPLPRVRVKSSSVYDLKLGVIGGCLLFCTPHYHICKVDMWIMKDYGVQESWTKIVLVTNTARVLWGLRYCCNVFRDYRGVLVSPKNGDVFMYNGGVVCYNQETKSFREIEITLTDERTRDAISYSPSFVSLYNLGEEVKWY
ncbi:F-box protein At3g07870-like [Pyrus x bretschneideri]|uniref:F-box protein At3g07870-like n=1 Tax=Pyrus x bretschneideri TaxID=225117 RepID=UPI00202EAE6F|nr:F-box protein At3g07870-like [Pyrus x bretschneideri]